MENSNDVVIELKLNVAQLTIIDQALQAMPYRAAAPLIGEINRQIDAQMKPDPMNAPGQEI